MSNKKYGPVVGCLGYMDVSENSGFSPQIIHFNGVFHCKPSILGYPYFWKHPCVGDEILPSYQYIAIMINHEKGIPKKPTRMTHGK